MPTCSRRSGIRVFLTDGFWRKSLAAVRALGRAGIEVTVAESTYLSVAMFSRYASTLVRTPSPLLSPHEYIECLLHYLDHHPHDVLIPMEEDTQTLISRHREAFAGRAGLFLADHTCLEMLQDKGIVTERAKALGIPVPRTFNAPDPEAGMALVDRLPYPLVVKPRVGSGGAGLGYVDGPEQLPAALRRAGVFGGGMVIQERIPRQGRGMGASFLMGEDQSVLASFVHERLREYPVTGGPSTLRQSVLHEEVREYGERLLRSFGFKGAAMVEFKIDPRDGLPKLLEVNPRFWGSLALAVDAGVNFPYLLTLAALGIPFEPVTQYKIGHRTRWLLPGDILHFIQNPERLDLDPSFFRFVESNLTYDIIDAEDPWPTLGSLLSLWPYFRSRDFEHVRRRRSSTYPSKEEAV